VRDIAANDDGCSSKQSRRHTKIGSSAPVSTQHMHSSEALPKAETNEANSTAHGSTQALVYTVTDGLRLGLLPVNRTRSYRL
jgi:hypothetical protein